jgi:hypothetical protein
VNLTALLAKIPAPIKTALRALAAVAAFAALKDLSGGGTLVHALDVAGAAVVPIALKYLDTSEKSYGLGS